MELNKMARMIPMYRVFHKNNPIVMEMIAHLVEVDSEAGGRDAQQRRHAFGPRHHPTYNIGDNRDRFLVFCRQLQCLTCPPTQSRTLVITI